MKYSLLAAILAGVILPGSARSAEDTPTSPGTIVGKGARIVTIPSKHSVDETPPTKLLIFGTQKRELL